MLSYLKKRMIEIYKIYFNSCIKLKCLKIWNFQECQPNPLFILNIHILNITTYCFYRTFAKIDSVCLKTHNSISTRAGYLKPCKYYFKLQRVRCSGLFQFYPLRKYENVVDPLQLCSKI